MKGPHATREGIEKLPWGRILEGRLRKKIPLSAWQWWGAPGGAWEDGKRGGGGGAGDKTE